MKHILPLLLTALLLTACGTSRHGGTPDVPSGGYAPPADGIEVKFSKMKSRHWCMPLDAPKVISSFGGKRPNHKGTDLKTHAKDKVRAAFEGVVTYSGQMRGYGNVVFISHPNGLETRYAHNSKNIAKKGKHVNPGDVIALEGKTGNATTEHVHFEMRAYDKAFDSEQVFDYKGQQLRKVTLTAKKKNGNIDIKVK